MTKHLRLFTIGLALWVGSYPVTYAQNDSTFTLNAQLLVAARQSDVEGVKKSLDRGALPNSRNRQGKTSLFMSIEKNQMEIFKLMLDAGADVNLPSLEKVTPLIAAVLSVLVIGEWPQPYHVMAFLLIVAGIFIATQVGAAGRK